jgi:hypothetical protein
MLTPIQLPNPKRNGRKERKSLFVPLFSVGFTPMIIRSQSAEIKKTSAKKLLVLTDSEIKFFIKLFFSSLLAVGQNKLERLPLSRFFRLNGCLPEWSTLVGNKIS